MGQNRTGKYFKYAIGEIILVVIGILIALGISNWNSERLQAERNRELLIKLSQELDQNITRAFGTDTAQNGFKERLYYTDSIIKILNKGISIDDFDFMVQAPNYYTLTLNLNSSIFEELKNTGSLYAIGSDSLVSSIQQYYKLCERESFYNLNIGATVNSRKENCIEGWLNFLDLYDQNPEAAINTNQWLFEPLSKNYIRFRQYIVGSYTHSNMMVSKIQQIIKGSEDLKKLISAEIKT